MTRALVLLGLLAGCAAPASSGWRLGADYAGGPTPSAAIRQAFGGPVRGRGGAEGDVLTLVDGAWIPQAPTSGSGDIEGVTAGTNLTGGGASGSVTLNLAASPSVTSLAVGTGTPAVFCATDTNTGLSWSGSDSVGMVAGGTIPLYWDASGLYLYQSAPRIALGAEQLTGGATSPSAGDVGLKRAAAGVWQVTDGASGAGGIYANEFRRSSGGFGITMGTSSGNVWVGAVQQHAWGAGQNWAENGSTAAPSYSFWNDDDTGVFLAAANQLGLSTGNKSVRFVVVDATPEGSIAAPVGSFASDKTNGALYFKVTGSGDTGWKAVTLEP